MFFYLEDFFSKRQFLFSYWPQKSASWLAPCAEWFTYLLD